MKLFALILSIVAFVPTISAHYAFSSFIINGNVTAEWAYVRPHYGSARNPVYLHKNTPMDFVCRPNAFARANETGIAIVQAGRDEVGFQSWTTPGRYHSHWQPYPIFHPGPLGVYLSKAPTGNVKDYDGSGEWFRILELGLNESVPMNATQQWYAEGQKQIKFRIPETTPPGQYLLRIEHLYLHSTAKGLQSFINCAHVDIRGPGGGEPAPLVHIWDYLNMNNSRLIVSNEMSNGYSRDAGWKDPGPAVWRGKELNETVNWTWRDTRRGRTPAVRSFEYSWNRKN